MKNALIYLHLLLLLLSNCSNAQVDKKKMKKKTDNPLICTPEKGICETPGVKTEESKIHPAKVTKPIHITYFTDPICSACWSIEPQLRKLKLEYGDYIKVEYRMGGLLPSWEGFNGGGISKPSDVAHHWDEMSHYYEMPIDGDVWLEDPLNSSYPPSIAFKAAQLQDEEKAILFLRRIREMVFLEKKNITKWEHLQQAAKETGLDTVLLKKDYEGKAIQLFEEDIAYTRKSGVRGFPALFFSDTSNNRLVLYGFKPYDNFEGSVLKLFPVAVKKAVDSSWENLFHRYSSLTAKEYAVLTGMSRQEAGTVLNKLSADNKLKKIPVKNGELWRK